MDNEPVSMAEQRRLDYLINQKLRCTHSAYADMHCAEMGCLNYYSRCPKHAYSGNPTFKCTRDIVR